MNYYVGVYVSDDMKSRKDCETELVFGEPENIAHKIDYSWKWVDLPCPSCGFTHKFKRDHWYESQPLGEQETDPEVLDAENNHGQSLPIWDGKSIGGGTFERGE